MPLTTDFRINLRGTLTGSAAIGNPQSTPEINFVASTLDGTAAGQANVIWCQERTVASAGTDSIDLSPIVDAIGNSLTPVRFVGLVVVNAPINPALANTTNLTIGGGTNAASNAFLSTGTATIGPLRPGGAIALWCATGTSALGTITAGTADILTITNSSGASATYQIGIVARTA